MLLNNTATTGENTYKLGWVRPGHSELREAGKCVIKPTGQYSKKGGSWRHLGGFIQSEHDEILKKSQITALLTKTAFDGAA